MYTTNLLAHYSILDNTYSGRSSNRNDKTARELMRLDIRTPKSNFNFGYPWESGHYFSYLLRVVEDHTGRDNYEIFTPQTWTHLCFGFELGISVPKVRIAKDGQLLSPNFAERHLTNLTVARELLLKINLGRCLHSWETGCAMRGVQVADFNLWDSAWSDAQLLDWTDCK